MSLPVDNVWTGGGLTGSIAPFVDVVGNIFTGGVSTLDVAVYNNTNGSDALLLPVGDNTTAPLTIDIYFTASSLNTISLGAIFRYDGAGNYYQCYFNPQHVDQLSNIAWTTGGHVAAQRVGIAIPAVLTGGNTYMMRCWCMQASALGYTSGNIVGYQVWNTSGGSATTQIGASITLYDNTPAMQISAQPTGGQAGIYVFNNSGSSWNSISRIHAYTGIPAFNAAYNSPTPYPGMNLAGGSFQGQTNSIGSFDTTQEIDYYAHFNLRRIRLCFLWDQMQPNAIVGGVWVGTTPLQPAVLASLLTLTEYAISTYNMVVEWDCHNYGNYIGNYLGINGFPATALGDFWALLAPYAQPYPNNVVIGTMNEPSGPLVQPAWTQNVLNDTIARIRALSPPVTNTISVMGTDYGGASNFVGATTAYSAIAFSDYLVDSGNNLEIQIHQYIDPGFAGVGPTVISELEWPLLLDTCTQWARSYTVNGRTPKLCLGEFGTGTPQMSLNALQNCVNYFYQNSDIWNAFEYWSGGPWNGGYFTNMDPIWYPKGTEAGVVGYDRTQWRVLAPDVPVQQGFGYFQQGFSVTQFGQGHNNVTACGVLYRLISTRGLNPAATGGDIVLGVFQLMPNSLALQGNQLDVIAEGAFAANGNTKEVKLWWNPTAAIPGQAISGGTLIGDTGASTANSAAWEIRGRIIKSGQVGSNAQLVQNRGGQVGTTTLPMTALASSAAVESGSVLLAVTGNAATSVLDILLNLFLIEGIN